MKKAVRRFALVYRPHTAEALTLAKDITAWIQKSGGEVKTAPEQKALPGAPLMKSSKEFDQIDLILVLGGDGTYLRAVRLLEGRQIPLLGFNLGSLGFLTVNPASEWKSLVQKTLSGQMRTEPRATLEATVRRGKKILGRFNALNDIVLERGSYSHLINAAISLGERQVSEVKADGFIVASPTGSTAYNLAAGGPLLDPAVKAFAITPVAPHALTTRPLIVPDDQVVIFRLVAGRGQKGHFIVDGQKSLEIEDSDVVEIRRGDHDHLALREKDFNDFHLLKEKLKFGDRA